MKETIKKILSNLPFVKSYFHGQAIILMLHRISPIDNTRIRENEGLKTDPQSLEKLVLTAKSQGYRFLSLDELYNHLLSNSFIDHKNIVITLDDGYKDNFTHGFPIFQKHNIPFCIYLSTNFLDAPNMWWYSLEDYLLQNIYIKTNDNNLLSLKTQEEKSKAFMSIRSEILSKIDTHTSATEVLKQYNIPHNEVSYKELALNPKEIQTMLSSNLLTLGCHTHTHPVFNNLSFAELQEDITKSLKIIKNEFNITSQHFCFPFGGNREINKDYCDFIKDFNFKTAVTTRSGTIYAQHKDFTHVLPRIFISGNIDFKDLIKFRKKRIVLY